LRFDLPRIKPKTIFIKERLRMKAPLDQAIKRAMVHLANIQAVRREAIPRIEPAKAIRQEEEFAITMGMSSENFRRQVIDHALLRMQTGSHGAGSERHELERTLLMVLRASNADRVEITGGRLAPFPPRDSS
jgi:hypothetical protein